MLPGYGIRRLDRRPPRHPPRSPVSDGKSVGREQRWSGPGFFRTGTPVFGRKPVNVRGRNTQIPVSCGDPKYVLKGRCPHPMFDRTRIAMIGKAGGKPLDQVNLPVRSSQQRARIRKRHPAIKPCHDRTNFARSEAKQRPIRIGQLLCCQISLHLRKIILHAEHRCATQYEECGLASTLIIMESSHQTREDP